MNECCYHLPSHSANRLTRTLPIRFLRFLRAHRCKHCKKLAPQWANLGELFLDTPRVVIAKYNKPKNNLPPGAMSPMASPEGVPSIRWSAPIKASELEDIAEGAPAPQRVWHDYSGDKKLLALATFVVEKSEAIGGPDLSEKLTQIEAIPPISEPVPPARLNSGPVTTVVGKSFDDIVLAAGTDVIVEFYAPWCKHCKALAPVWEKVGAAFAGVESVTVAKMDATANEHAMVSVQSFPTFLWSKAGDKSQLVPLPGVPRDEEGLIVRIEDATGTKRAYAEDGDKEEL